jgi:PIN domain nuclease of toxin-antitoxin system
LSEQFLLDTHIILAVVEERDYELPARIRERIFDKQTQACVSVLSLWELATKSRVGKLILKTPLSGWPDALLLAGAHLLDIEFSHVVADIGSEPLTKDPFDRLLLGICAAEGMKLITLDRVLAEHPLAWRDIPSVKK